MIQELGEGEGEGEKEEMMLEKPFGRGINFQIDTKDVQVIVNSLQKNNYPITRGIKDSWYRGDNLPGCREILVNDPDGYLLRFSQDIPAKR